MSKLIASNSEYAGWVANLKQRYQAAQIKAAIKVNSEMLQFYWLLGHDIVNRQMENTYGSRFFSQLSADLQRELPNAKGLSPTNIKYFKYFYELYSPMLQICPQVADKFNNLAATPFAEQLFSIPWDHHRRIIDKCKGNTQKAFFFVQKTKENNWSRAMLLNFLDTDLYEREGKAITNFKATLPTENSDLAQQLTKDPYCFDFLTLSQRYSEKELKDALISNVQRFLLELGNGFAFMGQEYRLQVSSKEQFLDLLFYNTRLHCYVVVEVKVTEFEPAYLGQLSAYMSFVNHTLKSDGDNATIGLLICKSKDNVYAQYSLEGYNHPIGISEFEGINILPADFKSTLPSIEEIETELNRCNKK